MSALKEAKIGSTVMVKKLSGEGAIAKIIVVSKIKGWVSDGVKII